MSSVEEHLEASARPEVVRPTAHVFVSPLVRKRRRTGWVLIAPAVMLVAGLLWLPILQAFYYGFTYWNGATAPWAGVGNYLMLFNNPEFVSALENNAALLATLPFVVVLPLFMAFLLNLHGRFGHVLRVVYFLPAALSWVVVADVALYVFTPNGPLDWVFRHLGLAALAPDWLENGPTALIALLLTVIWALFGVNTMIFISGLSTLDTDLLDAARIDGAHRVALFRHVVWPLMRRYTQFITVISIITEFSGLFALIYVMTGGGPGFSTTTLEFFVYQEGFNIEQYGAAAAAGTILFLVMFGINLIQLRFFVSQEQ